MNAFKTGKYARSLSTVNRMAPKGVRAAQREFKTVRDALKKAALGDPADWRGIVMESLAKMVGNLREAQSEIAANGLIVSEQILAGDRVVGQKRVLSPAFSVVDKIAPRLGLTASEQLLTPESQGEDFQRRIQAQKDARIALLLEHQHRVPLLPEAGIIETEAVESEDSE